MSIDNIFPCLLYLLRLVSARDKKKKTSKVKREIPKFKENLENIMPATYNVHENKVGDKRDLLCSLLQNNITIKHN